MRYLFVLLLTITISGCGLKNREIRTLVPTSKAVKKEAYCVYGKINGASLATQIDSFFLARLLWFSNWDPQASSGEIMAMLDDRYGNYHIMFKVYRQTNETIIEMRVPDDSYESIKDKANKIFQTDLSACKDIL